VKSRYATGVEEVRGQAEADVLELPSFHSVQANIEQTPLRSNWMLPCENEDTRLGLSSEFVTTLSDILRSLPNPILEVGPRNSRLARVLADHGAPVRAVGTPAPQAAASDRFNLDPMPEEDSFPTVLNAFAPPDSGVHQDVMHDSSVQSYLVLTARVAGVFDSSTLSNQRGWNVQPLFDLQRWMLTRHDMYVCDGRPLLRYGEAWLFQRIKPAGSR
jgi:hypothetical protein